MKTVDFLVMIYPCYLSMEAIRKPKNNELRHCCILWILWYSLVFVTIIIDSFFWWVPFISLFDTIKLLILLLSLREDIADNIRSLLVQPVYNRLKKYCPIYYSKFLDRIEKVIPSLVHYRSNLDQTFQLYKNIFSQKSSTEQYTSPPPPVDESKKARRILIK